MKRIIILAVVASLSVGCTVYKTFKTPEFDDKKEVLGGVDTLASESPVDLPTWREFFKDEKLQNLIEKGLTANTDVQIARKNIDQCETMLLTSKLAYLPSLGINATGGTSSFGGNALGESYNVPLQASWEIDLFGKIRNSKQQAAANLLLTKEYARQTELQITTLIANSYYTLIMLDRQLEIASEFVENQTQNVKVIEKLKYVGMQTEAAVNQAKANFYNTKTTKTDIELQIKLVENSIALLINETPQVIERVSFDDAEMLSGEIKSAISLETLSNRPDVKAAEYSLRSAFYGENVARSRMYPSLTISGSAGWTNSVGAIVNPGNLLLSALGSLTAPIFNKGVNRANLNVAKSKYEQSLLSFQKSLLKAGNEVSGLLVEEEKVAEKRGFRQLQIESNQKAYDNSLLLMEHSSGTYLEVLISQTALLSSKLTDAGEWMVQNQGAINLYKALGGGVEKSE